MYMDCVINWMTRSFLSILIVLICYYLQKRGIPRPVRSTLTVIIAIIVTGLKLTRRIRDIAEVYLFIIRLGWVVTLNSESEQ